MSNQQKKSSGLVGKILNNKDLKELLKTQGSIVLVQMENGKPKKDVFILTDSDL